MVDRAWPLTWVPTWLLSAACAWTCAACAGLWLPLVTRPAAAGERDPAELKVVDPGVAEEALRHLGDGTLAIEWDSRGEAPPRLVLVLASAVIDVAGRRSAELHLERRAVGQARPGQGSGGWKWTIPRQSPREAASGQAGSVDLATLYVPSREVSGMFVNLGRLLRQACHPRWPALDVPDLDRDEALRRASELLESERQAQAGGPARQEVTGSLKQEGRKLLLQAGDVTWELLPAPGREAALRILEGRAGATAAVQLSPQDEEAAPRPGAARRPRKAQLLRVTRVTNPPELTEEDGASLNDAGRLGIR